MFTHDTESTLETLTYSQHLKEMLLEPNYFEMK